MVNKDDIIKDILLEISYRSDEGYPNFSKPAHISILSEVLTEMGLTDVKYELIKNLLEEDKDELQRAMMGSLLNNNGDFNTKSDTGFSTGNDLNKKNPYEIKVGDKKEDLTWLLG